MKTETERARGMSDTDLRVLEQVLSARIPFYQSRLAAIRMESRRRKKSIKKENKT